MNPASYSKILFALLLLPCTLVSFSQDSTKELDPVTVTASLYPENVSKTGRNIVIIKGEQFSKLPVHSIDELLRYIPGVEIQQRGPMGSQADIIIRGATFQQVLVILDGVRINDPNTGHFNSYVPIAPSEIDRIEILKGASSAIYGSDAVGGVINIISKSFASRMAGKDKQISGMFTAGEYALVNTNAGVYYHYKRTAVSAGFLSNNTNGQLQRGTRGYFNNATASVSVNHYFNSNWKLSLRTAWDERKFSAQNFYTTFISDTASERVRTYWNQVQLAYEKDKNKFSLDAGYKWTRDIYKYNTAVLPNNNKSSLLQAVATYRHSFDEKTSIITGMQFLDNRIRSNDRGNHDVDQAAAFAIFNKNISNHFFLSPALRLDWDQRAGTELVPQLNLSWRTKGIQVRGSAGKTIRQADFTERFNNYNKALVTSGSIGNPDLNAERSLSYELGSDVFLIKNVRLSLTLFRRDQDNVIDYVNTPYSQMPRKDNLSPTGTYALATNIASVNTRGIETDLQYSKSFAPHQNFAGSLGLLLLHTATPNAVQSFYISSHAKFLTNFNVLYSNQVFSCSLNGMYKYRQPRSASAIQASINSDLFLVNARIDVFIFHQLLSLFAEVDNVGDSKIQDLLGSQLPGRWFMGGVRLSM